MTDLAFDLDMHGSAPTALVIISSSTTGGVDAALEVRGSDAPDFGSYDVMATFANWETGPAPLYRKSSTVIETSTPHRYWRFIFADADTIDLDVQDHYAVPRLPGRVTVWPGWETATGVLVQPGPAGVDGADGLGVPAGGATGQVLAKASSADGDTEWVDPSDGGSGPITVRGSVSAAGSVVRGTGFSVSKTGTGAYTVTFTSAFASAPIVVICSEEGGLYGADCGTVDTTSFIVKTGTPGVSLSDRAFAFIAMAV